MTLVWQQLKIKVCKFLHSKLESFNFQHYFIFYLNCLEVIVWYNWYSLMKQSIIPRYAPSQTPVCDWRTKLFVLRLTNQNVNRTGLRPFWSDVGIWTVLRLTNLKCPCDPYPAFLVWSVTEFATPHNLDIRIYVAPDLEDRTFRHILSHTPTIADHSFF